jgi:hypothetical protein
VNIRLSIPLGLVTLLAAAVVLAQTYPSFPGGETDQRTRRTQEQVEKLYVQGAYDRAYFIYRNELAPRGDKYAQYMIGYMHLTGAGVAEEDPAVALAWYRLAAERGEPSISLAGNELEETLNPTQVAATDALLAELKSELSDRVLIIELIREDLDLLRNSSWRGDARGGGHMLVIDRRYGQMSSGHYHQLIRNRIEARLKYLKGQVEVVDVGNGSEALTLAEIEAEIRRAYAVE